MRRYSEQETNCRSLETGDPLSEGSRHGACIRSTMDKIALALIVALMVTSATVFGQTEQRSKLRFSSNEGLRLDVRGKAITLFIIEDLYFSTANLGCELLFKSHSLGVDGSYFRWRVESDDGDDVAMYESYDRRKYLLLDYKFRFLYWGQSQVYLNSYCKTGSYAAWHTIEDYDLSTKDSILVQDRSVGTFNELGVGLGWRSAFTPSSRFGMDMSVNIARRFSTTDILTYSTLTESRFEDDVKKIDNIFYMRLNLYYRLIRSRQA